jgi:hypothetical protein
MLQVFLHDLIFTSLHRDRARRVAGPPVSEIGIFQFTSPLFWGGVHGNLPTVGQVCSPPATGCLYPSLLSIPAAIFPCAVCQDKQRMMSCQLLLAITVWLVSPVRTSVAPLAVKTLRPRLFPSGCTNVCVCVCWLHGGPQGLSTSVGCHTSLFLGSWIFQ